MAVKRFFDASKYDGSLPYGGVPLRDLEDEDWEVLPPHVQASVDALAYYRKTKPRPSQGEENSESSHEVSSEGRKEGVLSLN